MIRRRLTHWMSPLDTGAEYVLPEPMACERDQSKTLAIIMLAYSFLVAAFALYLMPTVEDIYGSWLIDPIGKNNGLSAISN